MFASKVAKPQTKAAKSPTSKLAPRRSTLVEHRLGHDPVEQMLFLQRTIGNRAALRLLAQQASRAAGSAPGSDHEQEVAPENMMARKAPHGASWNFQQDPTSST